MRCVKIDFLPNPVYLNYLELNKELHLLELISKSNDGFPDITYGKKIKCFFIHDHLRLC